MCGKDGYTYRKPFDYFAFSARVSNVNGLESLSSRGLLFGAPYSPGNKLHGYQPSGGMGAVKW